MRLLSVQSRLVEPFSSLSIHPSSVVDGWRVDESSEDLNDPKLPAE